MGNSGRVWALTENQPIHFSGDRQVWNRKGNEVELFGHATVRQPGEKLVADSIHLNLTTHALEAQGSCVYESSDMMMWGDEMRFNLSTRTGSVFRGRISDERFTLTGSEIHKLGGGRFQTIHGKYTTCRDCSASWSFEAQKVDLQLNGYASLSGVTVRVKDAPAFWLPYLVVPVKTQRQTGFLFPELSVSGINGTTFLLPLFIAINRSLDMTLGLGEYSLRGRRLEWETRYTVSPRSHGTVRLYGLTDRQFSYASHRWGVDLAQTQELPWNIEEKLRLSEVSDNLFPFHFAQHFSSTQGEAFLPSRLIFSHGSGEMSGFFALQRYRNLLNSKPNDPRAQNLEFDSRTVQAFPNAVLTTNGKNLWGSAFVGGMTVAATNFTRAAGAFDFDVQSDPTAGFTPGRDPIRKATRFSMVPSLYTTFRPFDAFSVVPSMQYHYYFYNFHGTVPDLKNRGYLLFQVDLMAQLEKIYESTSNPQKEDKTIQISHEFDHKMVQKSKHLIRPLLSYSWIPVIHNQADHPFVSQMQNAQKRNLFGYNFDDNDIIPYSYNKSGANYFVPQGNSLSYGFTTQWIQKVNTEGLTASRYRTLFEWSAGQAINFLEVYRPQDPSSRHIFTRFFSDLRVNTDHLFAQTTYYYYPDISSATPRHTLSTTASYVFERGMHQQVLVYDRSLNLSYTFNKVSSLTSNLSGTLNFSLSDYILPYASLNYSFRSSQSQPSQLLGAAAGVHFQNPSRCWKLTLGSTYASGLGISTAFDLSLNLAGTGFAGFGGVADLRSQSMTNSVTSGVQ